MNVCVVGLGLIGGSVALAAKARGMHVFGVDLDRSAQARARMSGAFVGVYSSFDALWRENPASFNDMVVVIATPPRSAFLILSEIGFILQDNMHIAITDVNGAKTKILHDAEQALGDYASLFIGAHPLIGLQKIGFVHADKNLFAQKKVVLCPSKSTSKTALARVQNFWQNLGASTHLISVAEHDKVLAKTSHLPHFLSYAFIKGLSPSEANYSDSSLYNTASMAGGDPLLWQDIFLDNRVAVLFAIDDYMATLTKARDLLIKNDRTALQKWLQEAHASYSAIADKLSSEKLSSEKLSSDKLSSEKISSGTPSSIDTHSIATPAQVSVVTPNDSPSDKYIIDESLLDLQLDSNDLMYHILPANPIKGRLRVPGDKSISHRAIILGALATGVTRVRGLLLGDDVLCTQEAFRMMGVRIEQHGDATLIKGVGLAGLSAPNGALHMGNSATSMRILMGVLASQSFTSVMIGDESLTRRPMARIAKPLAMMGAQIAMNGDTAPVRIKGTTLKAIDYPLPQPSAQLKSAVIMAALRARGETIIYEPAPSRDHTERMLRAFGYDIKYESGVIGLSGGGDLTACSIDVPADISSAAFFMVAAAISQGGSITLNEVGVNPTRTGVIDILRQMGADISIKNERLMGEEPVADITVNASDLVGVQINPKIVPLAIDEFPVLFIAAACAKGTTRLTGASELRIKESDRIKAMATGLLELGIECRILEDGIEINGKTSRHVFCGGTIDSQNDHRVAMSFAIASVRASAPIVVQGAQSISTSFPDFERLANSVGLNIRAVHSGFLD